MNTKLKGIFIIIFITPQLKCQRSEEHHQDTTSPFTLLKSTLLGPPDEVISSTVPPLVFFSIENNTHIRAQVGSTAVLRCPAGNVGENTVSWIRRRDYHLLTVGLTLYSSDQRYQVRFMKDEQDWQLHIRYVQKHDEGVYECQISSHPPISLIAALDVVEATSEVLGGPEKFLRTGSSLRLVCILRKTTQPPTYVFWYLGTRMINYDPNVKVETSGDISVLFLTNLGPESSGNYSCVPSNARPSTIHIQVLRGGEIPAAIQSGEGRLIESLNFSLFACCSLLLLYYTLSQQNPSIFTIGNALVAATMYWKKNGDSRGKSLKMRAACPKREVIVSNISDLT